MTSDRKLHAVRGGRRERITVEGVDVLVARSSGPSAPHLIRVEEEDTHLVLSAPPEVPDRPEHPIRVFTAIWHDEPIAGGTVVVRPRALLAVVHDLALDPTVRPEWVRAAVATCCDHARAAGAGLDVPLLGAVHGTMPIEDALDAWLEAVAQGGLPRGSLLRVRASDARRARVEARLGAWAAGRITPGSPGG